MSESKEKQWAVMKYRRAKPTQKNLLGNPLLVGLPLKVWSFDAREDARQFANRHVNSKAFAYAVTPMTRGPNA